MTRKSDPSEVRARELAVLAGIDPDTRIPKPASDKSWPAWCQFRQEARKERNVSEAEAAALALSRVTTQGEQYCNAPLSIMGSHDEGTIQQMKNCMSIGNVVAGAICADGHLGYAQPVGGVIAYENQISISGVGFDIACGNMAARLDVKRAELEGRETTLAQDIARSISFGVGRKNNEQVEHAMFDDADAWQVSGMADFRAKAQSQLGTVGSGNHYVDLMEDDEGFVWIGVHFGSRGLGHTSATRHLKLVGAKDGIHVPPAVIDADSNVGRQYLAAMELAGIYAYAGREWVVQKVRSMIGGAITDSVHNHHNFAWKERHGDRDLWVVRKGATPAFPGQRGFVGGSMGDDCVILKGQHGARSQDMLFSTVHGAGRLFGRKEAKRRFARAEMDEWLQRRRVTLVGADLDESPMAYRRLPEVLAEHDGTIQVEHTLRPFVVVMAGENEFDPFKD